MGSRARGSAAPNTQRQRGSTNGINTGGIPYAKPSNTHQPDGTGPAITPAGPEQPAVLPESHGSRLPPVHIRPRTGRSAFPGTLRFGDRRPRRIGDPAQAVTGLESRSVVAATLSLTRDIRRSGRLWECGVSAAAVAHNDRSDAAGPGGRRVGWWTGGPIG